MPSDDPHPADLLIRELIAHLRSPTEQEIRLITDRIASAPFNQDMQKVSPRLRGRRYSGVTLDAQLPSLTLHWIQHVGIERQWATGTTIDTYVETLHRAARELEARIALYRQWESRDIAAAIVSTRMVLHPHQMGTGTLPNRAVAKSASGK